MKYAGIVILVAGLILGVFALNMNVSVDVESRDYGYGISTPSMQVANVNLIAQRQNFLIFSGILSVVGAILAGFGAMAPAVTASPQVDVATAPVADEDLSNDDRITLNNGLYRVGEYSFDRIEDARLFAADNPEGSQEDRAKTKT